MLQPPEFPHPTTEGKSYVCADGDTFHAYLDRNAAVELLYGLHWLARDQPVGEELDIHTRWWQELPRKGTTIGLCELNFVTSHMRKKAGKNIREEPRATRNKLHGVYTPEYDRLDYHVNAEDVQAAYASLTELLRQQSTGAAEAVIFGTLVLHLVS